MFLNGLVARFILVVTIDVEAIDETVVLVKEPSQAGLADQAVEVTSGKLNVSRVRKTGQVIVG